MKTQTVKSKSSLVGKWFLTWNHNKEVVWQGHIIGRPSSNVYLVQLFEWLMGEPSEQKLINISEMTSWTFYDSNDELTDAYQKYSDKAEIRRKRERYAKEQQEASHEQTHNLLAQIFEDIPPKQ